MGVVFGWKCEEIQSGVRTKVFDDKCVLTPTGTVAVVHFKLLVCLACSQCGLEMEKPEEESSLGANLFTPPVAPVTGARCTGPPVNPEELALAASSCIPKPQPALRLQQH